MSAEGDQNKRDIEAIQQQIRDISTNNENIKKELIRLQKQISKNPKTNAEKIDLTSILARVSKNEKNIKILQGVG